MASRPNSLASRRRLPRGPSPSTTTPLPKCRAISTALGRSTVTRIWGVLSRGKDPVCRSIRALQCVLTSLKNAAGDDGGKAAIPAPGKEAVEVAAIRHVTLAAANAGQVDHGEDNHAAAHTGGIEFRKHASRDFHAVDFVPVDTGSEAQCGPSACPCTTQTDELTKDESKSWSSSSRKALLLPGSTA